MIYSGQTHEQGFLLYNSRSQPLIVIKQQSVDSDHIVNIQIIYSTYGKHPCGCLLLFPWVCTMYFQTANNLADTYNVRLIHLYLTQHNVSHCSQITACTIYIC